MNMMFVIDDTIITAPLAGTILPGVTIGENAVVGAASVVTRDVAPNTIVAGNPAKLLRSFDPSTDNYF